jgi:methionyl-tRNA formyltransferase
MKNIVFLGGKKIGLECLIELVNQAQVYNYNLLGVGAGPRGKEILDFCSVNHITVIESEIPACDILISVQYHRILAPFEIKKAKEIAVNLHMAPLPEYRGCNQFSFAIIDKATEFGTTVHEISEGIDTGDILFEERFPISNNIWVKDLYDLTYNKSLKLFRECWPKLISGEYSRKSQKNLLSVRNSSYYKRSDIDNIKEVSLSWDAEKIERHVRATMMPGFPPPYFLVDDKMITLQGCE